MRVLLAAAVALIVAAPAAAATPIYWTPTHMVQALVALQYPHPGTFSGACSGAVKGRKGAFPAFRCLIRWQQDGPPITTGTVRVYAKPMPRGRVCGSTASLARCVLLKAGPLANDPRVCQVADPVACAQAASKAAVVKKNGIQVNLACTQGSTVFVWSCTSTAGTVTVTWTKGVSSWVATISP